MSHPGDIDEFGFDDGYDDEPDDTHTGFVETGIEYLCKTCKIQDPALIEVEYRSDGEVASGPIEIPIGRPQCKYCHSEDVVPVE